MARYVIGDIQGCYEGLSRLLDKVKFDPACDTLYAVGDLIARGEDSLSTIRLLRSLGNQFSTVLGNHDLHFLAVSQGLKKVKANDKLDTLLACPELPDIIEWYRQWPLAMMLDDNTIMVHAGLYPDWSLSQLCALSQEISAELQSPRWCQLLENMYGNGPTHWDQGLSGTARQRFIINSTTRMRFLSADGGLNMKAKYAPKDAPGSLNPWFKVNNPQLQPEQRVIFGHWAALMGHTESSQFQALDTGYVWGNQLTLLNLDLRQTFAINA